MTEEYGTLDPETGEYVECNEACGDPDGKGGHLSCLNCEGYWPEPESIAGDMWEEFKLLNS